MRTLRYLIPIMIAALVLSACGSATPTPPAQPTPLPPTSTPAPADTLAAPQTSPVAPQSSLAPRATRPPQPTYPPRPTATAYAAVQSSEPGVFANADRGISVRYPRRWRALPPDQQSSDILTYFVNDDGSVFATLIAGPLSADQSLQAIVSTFRDGLANELSNSKTISAGALQLADGHDAWNSVMTGTRKSDSAQLKINITATGQGGRGFVLLIFGDPADYNNNQDDIDQLVGALHVERPKLFGIGREQSLVLAGGESTNPREYDPATTHGSGDKLIFSGLVSFDQKLNLVPELASAWDVQDGITYTFHLRPDARFHNGKPVTAYDVIYSWERAADPKTKSDTVLTYLGDIVGVKEMNEGKADHIGGLTPIDEHTLQVVIDAPKPYFLLKLTYPTAFVLDQANVESGPDWFRTPNGTGPYRLARWDKFKLMLYERNDDYYLDPAQIPYIIVQLYTGNPIRLYESGDIDVSGVGSFDLQRFEDPKEPMHTELLSGVSLCTGMIIFDNQQPPFDDPKVRQAFATAFDRTKYIDVVLHGNALPATGLFPPGLPGYNPDLRDIPYNPEQARQLLAQSKYGSANQLPPIVYTDGGLGNDSAPDVAALAQMWQKNLGVTITIENIEPDKYSDELHAGHHGQLFSLGWCADYPDPENFADALFHTGAQQNLGNYSNPELDKILEQARVEQDVTKRIQLYQQAEQLIVNDAPVLFTTHSLSHVLVKPHIKGYTLTPIDIPLERYLSIDPSQLK